MAYEMIVSAFATGTRDAAESLAKDATRVRGRPSASAKPAVKNGGNHLRGSGQGRDREAEVEERVASKTTGKIVSELTTGGRVTAEGKVAMAARMRWSTSPMCGPSRATLGSNDPTWAYGGTEAGGNNCPAWLDGPDGSDGHGCGFFPLRTGALDRSMPWPVTRPTVPLIFAASRAGPRDDTTLLRRLHSAPARAPAREAPDRPRTRAPDALSEDLAENLRTALPGKVARALLRSGKFQPHQ